VSQAVPQGKLARTRIAGATALKVGASHLAHRIKRPFLSEARQQLNKELLDDKNAQILFKALTQLRGTALKLAQMLGMDQGLLPESYRKELEKSFHQVPPLNRVLVRKVMLNELGETAENLYIEFESEAFAAASLGQVHKATLKNTNNETVNVAVKIQYPGIKNAIKNDLSMIRGIARGMSNTKIILQSLDEVEARLMEEVDYKIEAKNTLWFKEKIKTRGIAIPHVYQEKSSQRVLTTEFIHGLHLDAWLATNPSQKIINNTAQRLYDFFDESTSELQCLHADPNPGNYLFHENGDITIIDFGCVRHLSDTFTDAFPRLLFAYLQDDHKALFQAYDDLGMSENNFDEAFYQEVLRPFGQWVTLPFKEDTFDFAKHSDYTLQGQLIMKNLHDKISVEHIAEEFIFHNRTIYGLYQIFEKMGATVCLTDARKGIS
jgi:predicted unusual protein kinase regulating ubiquinone biosynthesis (AarF/ABC1/UbiB family)